MTEKTFARAGRARLGIDGLSIGDPAASGGAGEIASWRLWLMVILGTLLVWRIAALNFAKTELFFDEAQYWFWSTQPAFGYYSKPPLIAWVIRASTDLCGPGEFCIRLPSAIIHTGTALFVYAAAARLYGRPTGFWSAVAYATLPAVSLSSGLISTDVPLLFFWAGALYALILIIETRSWLAALGLGVALGLGLLSKYAMIYFVLCTAFYAFWSRKGRLLWRDARFYFALAVGAAILAPNVAWNMAHHFATFSHTADNAKLGGSLFHLGPLLEFLGGQFAVMGPILFAAFVLIAVRALRHPFDEPEKLLISFSVPLIALIAVQAFLSRAHANWAAPAYIAATILVIATLPRMRARTAFNGSFALHGALAILISAAAITPDLGAPFGITPFERVLGWRAMSEAADRLALEHGAKSIAADKRSIAAELSYYSRSHLPVKAWNTPGTPPSDHFEMVNPVTAGTPSPMLYVSANERTSCVAAHFGRIEALGKHDFATGSQTSRPVYFYLLSEPQQAAFAAPPDSKPGCVHSR